MRFLLFPSFLFLVSLQGCSTCTSGDPVDKRDEVGDRDAQIIALVSPRDAAVDEKDLIDEIEPNDSPQEAQVLPMGKGVRGFIGKPSGPKNEKGDRDFYRFTLSDEQPKWNLQARLTGVPGLRIVLEIRAQKTYERLFVSAAPRNGDGVTLTNLVLEPGTYFFRVRERWTGKVRRYNLKTPYILRWKASELTTQDEIEPNDTFSQATDMEVNTKRVGYLGTPRDVDFFKVNLGDPAKDTMFHVSVSGLKGVAMRVTLYDDSMTQVLERTGKRGETIVFRNLRIGDPGGHFFVRLESAKGFNPEEQYILNVGREASSDALVEREPNDTIATANFLPGDGDELHGTLDSKEDRDTFRLNVSKPMNLRLSVKPEDGLDVAVNIFDRKGRLQLTADGGKRGFEEIIPNFRVRPGDVFIQVVNSPQSPPTTGRYVISWRLSNVEQGDEAEPNDKMSQATLLRPGVSARGFIYPPGDVDFFRFRLSGRAGTTGRVLISAQGIPNVQLKISLIDSGGNILKESDERSFAGIRKMEVNLHVGKWYFIKVEDYDGRRSNSVDNYELEVIRQW